MKRIAIGLAGLLLFCGSVLALTPQQLKEMLNRGAAVMVIDVRSTSRYQEDHIPGAINIPAAVIGRKRLPPLGEVVVCGDGIRRDITEKAVAELNAKEGIRAEMLEGGLAGWGALNFPTTRHRGLFRSPLRYVSYRELEAAVDNDPDIILVDLRAETKGVGEQGRTDLAQKFSGHRVIKVERGQGPRKSRWDVSEVIQGGGKRNAYRYLYVLVDNGDGQAEKVVRRLHAAGVKRVAILTGGEQTLSRQGQAGQVIKQTGKRQPEN